MPDVVSRPGGASGESAVLSKGLAFGLGTYLIWGFFPLYFVLLKPAGALEVIVHRTFWAMVFCFAVLAVRGKLHQIKDIVSRRDLLLPLVGAGFLIIINWTTYIYAVQTGRVVEASLGYFVNPLFTVFLALAVLHERLSKMEYLAITLGLAAIVVYVAGLGYLPWIALVLPLSFGIYSLVKKNVATQVPPVAGMFIETATVTPFLLVYLAYLAIKGESSLQIVGAAQSAGALAQHCALLIGAGVITAIPLILIAAASRHLPLGMLGMLQYISPIMQLVIGVWLFHEPMGTMRWVATFIIWAAVIIVSVDMWRRTYTIRHVQMKISRRAKRGAGGAGGERGAAGKGGEGGEGANPKPR